MDFCQLKGLPVVRGAHSAGNPTLVINRDAQVIEFRAEHYLPRDDTPNIALERQPITYSHLDTTTPTCEYQTLRRFWLDSRD